MNQIVELLNIDEVKDLLKDSKHSLICVSGGLDSMTMLTWFGQHKSEFNTEFESLYIDHGIHPDSAKWGEFTSHYSQTLMSISCSVVKVSLDGLGNNLEYAARRARYKTFCEHKGSHGQEFDTLIIAHHINDQCETFMLKLFRGSGVKGLSAMPIKSPCWYDENIEVIRPMLSLTRAQIEDWAEENNVQNITDSSNADNKYDRNFIRNKIWPVIQERFDIADINTVRSIAHLSEAWELMTELADMDIHNGLITLGLSQNGLRGDGWILDWEKIQKLSYIRIKNVILRILGNANIYSFSINHVEQFSQGLIDATVDSRNELSLKGFMIKKVGKKIHVSNTNQN